MKSQNKKTINRILLLFISISLVITTFFSGCSNSEFVNKNIHNDIDESSVSDFNYVSLNGDFTDVKVTDEESAMRALEDVSETLGISDVSKELKICDFNVVAGNNYYRMQQYYNDIPVYGKTVCLAVDEDGNVTDLTSNTNAVYLSVQAPAVSLDEAKDKIVKKFNVTQNDVYCENPSDGLIIFENESEYVLAYVMYVCTDEGVYQVFVDAEKCKIIKSLSQVFTDNSKKTICWNSDKSTFFNGFYNDSDSKYQMFNSDLDIYVLSLEKTNSFAKDKKQTFIVSDDNCFGNTSSEKDLETDKAVDYINNIEKIRNYFLDKFSDKADEKLFCYYNDGIYSGNNGYATVGQSDGSIIEANEVVGIISIGYNKNLNQIDLLAHEYMHRVEQNLSSMNYERESGALMEAYSDIFGEIVEGNLQGKTIDWNHNNIRNIIDPSKSTLPTIYQGQYWYDTSNADGKHDNGGVHYNSTVISHAAYLMWNGIDGDNEKKIDADLLSKIWYKALNLMQSDATFHQCANNVYKCAKSTRGVTDKQLECVKEAFENVGLSINDGNTLKIEQGGTLFVDDINFKHYDNYHLKIYSVLSIGRKGIVRNDKPTLVIETDVKDDNGYIIDLDLGLYKLVVTDNDTINGSKNEYKVNLQVNAETLVFSRKTVTIHTDFGHTIIEDFSVPDSMVMTIGEINVIEPETKPADAVGYSFKWKSSDESVATVVPTGENGIVTSKSKGTATIIAEIESKGTTITRETKIRVASQGRDTVLVLDVSGSMSGQPITEMKESAINFCEELLKDEYNNRVGLVTYDYNIATIDLTNDLDYLTDYIYSLSSGSTTNMQGALQSAETMLDKQGKEDNIKNVVIMADGLPNEGQKSYTGAMSQYSYYSSSSTDVAYANGVVNQAESIMSKYNMYSLGFFHDLYGTEKDFATDLMKLLTNMNDGYHQVEESENLQFAFGDIQETISDGSKIVINIACPVDVIVSYDGETLSSASNTYSDVTSFGTLQLLGSKKDIKVLSLIPDIDYDIKLEGTDIGTMNYFVNYIDDDDNLYDYRNFEAVPITSSTIINSNTDNSADCLSLDIDKDGDGVIDEVWSAAVNGVATITYTDEEPEKIEETEKDSGDNRWKIVLISLSVVFVLGDIIILIVVLCSKNRKKSSSINMPVIDNSVVKKKVDVNTNTFKGKICIQSGSMNGEVFDIINGYEYRIGRDRNNTQITFSNDYVKVGRIHCIVRFDYNSNSYYITDYSTNGTFLSNGQRLVKNVRTKVPQYTTLLLADKDCKIKLL